MTTILGDTTIRSLLNVVTMDAVERQEIITLLPVMDEQDRLDVLGILYQLFALQTENKIVLKEAEFLAKKLKQSGPFDWKKFSQIEQDILAQISRSD